MWVRNAKQQPVHPTQLRRRSRTDKFPLKLLKMRSGAACPPIPPSVTSVNRTDNIYKFPSFVASIVLNHIFVFGFFLKPNAGQRGKLFDPQSCRLIPQLFHQTEFGSTKNLMVMLLLKVACLFVCVHHHSFRREVWRLKQKPPEEPRKGWLIFAPRWKMKMLNMDKCNKRVFMLRSKRAM